VKRCGSFEAILLSSGFQFATARLACARFLLRPYSTTCPLQSQPCKMSQSGKGLDWADQWDPHYEDKNSNDLERTPSKSTNKEKMDKAKAAAAVGMQKTKAVATVGMEKTKVAATFGAQKLKAGSSASFKWIKEKVQKKPQ